VIKTRNMLAKSARNRIAMGMVRIGKKSKNKVLYNVYYTKF